MLSTRAVTAVRQPRSHHGGQQIQWWRTTQTPFLPAQSFFHNGNEARTEDSQPPPFNKVKAFESVFNLKNTLVSETQFQLPTSIKDTLASDIIVLSLSLSLFSKVKLPKTSAFLVLSLLSSYHPSFL